MTDFINQLDALHQTDNKLILIVGRPGSGKSKIIHDYSHEKGIPIVDFSKIINDSNHDIHKTLYDFLKNYRFPVLLLDNKTLLYQHSSKDILDILKDLSKNITVISTWNGFIEDGQLSHIIGKKEDIYPIDQSFQYLLV